MPDDPDLSQLPSIHDDPVRWDPQQRRFVPDAAAGADPEAPTVAAGRPAGGRVDDATAVDVEAFASPEASPVGWQRAPLSSPVAPPRPAPRAAAAVAAAPVAAAAAAPVGYSRAAPAPPAPPAPQVRPQAPRPPRPPAQPRPARARRPRRRGRLIKRLVIGFLAFVLLLVGGLFAFGWWQFSRIDRVDVAAVLSPQTGSATNYLVVGSDSREGITGEDANAGAFLGPGEPGGTSRTDSILVLRVDSAGSSLLSIPRDLWVKDPKTGQFGRINALYQGGPANLIRGVQSLGIPVHHYLEINFVSFAGLVDAVGGIEVNFEFPTRDRSSGLQVDTPGLTHLDGTQGLAYVRSRHFEELKNGKWVEDPLSDLSRVTRQRLFLSALVQKVTDTKNPVALARVAGSFGSGLKIDNKMTYFQAIGLAWKLRGFSPASTTIPTRGRTTAGGAQVLDLAPEAPTVLAQFG